MRKTRMGPYLPLLFSLMSLFSLFTAAGALALETVVLEPSQDNSLYETAIDDDIQQNERSNGAGSYLFAGRTGTDAGSKLRRALLQFDLFSNLPADVEIVYAHVDIFQSRAAPGSPLVTMGLHRVLQAWGEGASKGFGAEGQGSPAEPGDATWHHRVFPDELWDTPGGSFASTVSAGTVFGQDNQHYTWSCNDKLLLDLNDWLDHPELNFGWVIIGGEAGEFSAHRFDSRENNQTGQRPELTLVYRRKDDIFEDSFEQFSDCQ